mgnify:CR=1 FL=1
MSEQSYIDKYRPETLDEVAGQGTDKVRKKAEKNEPVILYGPAGTGKTSTAEALANEKNWNTVEINASSARTKADIISIAQQIRTSSIDDNKTLFILDELDSIDGRSIQPLLDVLDEPKNPIIGTANELWKVPDSIENRCTTYKYDLKKDDIKPFLKQVAQKENIDISSRQLGQLATRNGLRDALNDLQQFSESDADTDWDSRQTDDSPFAVIERVLRNKDYIGGQDMTPPDMVDFLDENLPGEFEGVELLRAYQALAKADQFHNIVNTKQDYSWWKFTGSITEEVANIRLSEPYDGWMNINYPSSRRVSAPRPNSNSPEGTLYEELKDVEMPKYKASFNYQEFTNEILPILKSLDEEEQYQLILSESLSDKSIKALDVSKSLYESWLMEEDKIETKENTTLGDFSEDNSDESEEMSIFDL